MAANRVCELLRQRKERTTGSVGLRSGPRESKPGGKHGNAARSGEFLFRTAGIFVVEERVAASLRRPGIAEAGLGNEMGLG